jgi:hypothetical protein
MNKPLGERRVHDRMTAGECRYGPSGDDFRERLKEKSGLAILSFVAVRGPWGHGRSNLRELQRMVVANEGNARFSSKTCAEGIS